MADLLLRTPKCPLKIDSDSISSSARTETHEIQRMGPFSETTPWAALGLCYHHITLSLSHNPGKYALQSRVASDCLLNKRHQQ